MESKFKSLRKKSKSLLIKFLDEVTCNKGTSKRKHQVEGNSSSNEEEDDFFTPTASPINVHIEQTNDDDSTITPKYVCEICVETKPLDTSFNIQGCSHFYCIECIVKHIESKLDDNVTHIACPVMNCEGVLDPDFCRGILPLDLFNRWGKALCESALPESEKFYCPYNDCSALLIDDGNDGNKNNFDCPFCNRVFCVRCKVAWHEDFDCETFQKLKPLGADAMLSDLAKRKNWKQCPNCKFYVVKNDGCNYIRCKCGTAFCYYCGAESDYKSHRCYKCKR